MGHLNYLPIWRDANRLMLDIEQAVRGGIRSSNHRLIDRTLPENIMTPVPMINNRLRVSLLLACLLLPLSVAAQVTCTNENTAIPATTPTSNFTVLGDGSIVRHEPTGLEWQRCALGQSWDGATCQGTAGTYTWQQALQAADTQSGWRLPDKNELASIVEQRCWSPAINTTVFPNTPSDWFWSSSPYAHYSGRAWIVRFYYGRDGAGGLSEGHRVRLVHAGQ